MWYRYCLQVGAFVLSLIAQPRTLVERLESVFKNEPLGEPSLQNSLELARAALR